MPINLNISTAVTKVANVINQNGKNISREIANAVVTDMSIRIFEDGKAADGGQIGVYSSSYLKLRQSKKYHRSGDSKVIVSLTRKLVNNFGVVEAGEYYGIGVTNQADADKMDYVEQRFDKKIADLTDDESALVEDAAIHILDRYLQ